MEIKLDNRVAVGIGVVVLAVVGYQEYTEPDGFLNSLNSEQTQNQSWGPNPSPYGPQTNNNPYGPQNGPQPNANPYGPQPGPAPSQPNPYGPSNQNPYGPAQANGPYGPSPYGPSSGPSGYGPSSYGPSNYGPEQGPYNGYGPNGPSYGPGQTDYTSETYEVDLGEPTEPDGW